MIGKKELILPLAVQEGKGHVSVGPRFESTQAVQDCFSNFRMLTIMFLLTSTPPYFLGIPFAFIYYFQLLFSNDIYIQQTRVVGKNEKGEKRVKRKAGLKGVWGGGVRWEKLLMVFLFFFSSRGKDYHLNCIGVFFFLSKKLIKRGAE